MGHIESYYFVDPREGEYGVEYHRPTREEAEELAVFVGWAGEVLIQLRAYPPKPTAAVLAHNICCSEQVIPF